MANVEVTYYLSEEGQKNAILNGFNGESKQKIEIPFVKELKDIVEITKEGDLYYRIVKTPIIKTELNKNYNGTISPNISAENILFDNLLKEENAYDEMIKLHDIKLNYNLQLKALVEYCENYNDKIYEKKKEEERIEKEKKESYKKERIEKKEKSEKEKTAWIHYRGSDYLKNATKLGYDCKRQYVIERASFEYPDFTVDFDDNAEWKTRTQPSQKAINKVMELLENNLELKVKVVWLTSMAYDEREEEKDYEFEEQEAIVINEFLGEYDLVHLIN